MKFLTAELQEKFSFDLQCFGTALARTELIDGEQTVVEVLDLSKIVVRQRLQHGK